MFVGRVYTVIIKQVVSPVAAFDLMEFVPAAAKPIRLARLRISQTSEPTTEEEQLAITITRGATTSGSGGAAPTPRQVRSTEPNPGFTAETMNTTQATGGTPVDMFADVWNTRQGYDMAFSPEEGIEAVNGERLVIQHSAPADAITITATAWIEEVG